MSTQLELSLTTRPDPTWVDQAIDIARAAIDPASVPGRSYFTTGAVHISSRGERSATLTVDTRWAASAIRTALLDTGHAIDADPANESTLVTVWAVRHAVTATPPLLDIVDEAEDPTRPGFLLNGPNGCVEQQCGAAGHNHLIAHAGHPFPGSARGACDRHGDLCWRRWSWPLAERARHLLAGSYTATGTAVWRLTPKAEQQMRALYLTYIHATRPE